MNIPEDERRGNDDRCRSRTCKRDEGTADAADGQRPSQPADSLYRVARKAVSSGDYERAATLFSMVSARYGTMPYAPDAMYWEAFSRYRNGGSDDLRRAQSILATCRRNTRATCASVDASSLSTRICGELAREGDAGCAAKIAAKAAWAANVQTAK